MMVSEILAELEKLGEDVDLDATVFQVRLRDIPVPFLCRLPNGRVFEAQEVYGSELIRLCSRALELQTVRNRHPAVIRRNGLIRIKQDSTVAILVHGEEA